MKVDLLYSSEKCRAHAEPAWRALPEALRGVEGNPDAIPWIYRLRREAAERAIIVASRSDAGVAKRHGYTRIALLEHGIGQSYIGHESGSYPGGVGRDMVGLFLSPNETAAARDRAAYPKARVEVVGCPRLDTLPGRSVWGLPVVSQGPVVEVTPDGVDVRQSAPVVAISFHWTNREPPEMRSAFPHYRDALAGLAQRFTVIGHAHPLAMREVLPAYEKAGIEVVESFDEVCRRADVYVADNTSTLYEFASTGRPVVVLNAPWFRRDVKHGLRFWEAELVGPHCEDPIDLIPAVDLALEDDPVPFRNLRERALDIVYAYRKGASKRAAKAIVEWLA